MSANFTPDDMPAGPPRQCHEPPTEALGTKNISRQAGGARLVVLPGATRIRMTGFSSRPGPGGIRGVIAGLSPGSKRRLMWALAHVDWRVAQADFITLTYHYGFQQGHLRWHVQLNYVEKLLRRRWGPQLAGGMWVLEFQKRGAPHFHLIVFWKSAPSAEHFARWVARVWTHLAERGDRAALKHGTRVDRVRIDEAGGVGKLMRYLVKYVGKADTKKLVDATTGEVLETGRMWGEFGDVPKGSAVIFTLNYEDRVRVSRRLRRWGKAARLLRRVGRDVSSATVYGDPPTILQLLRGIVPDTELAAAGIRAGPLSL